MREKLIELFEDIEATCWVPIKVDKNGCGSYDIMGAEYIADKVIACLSAMDKDLKQGLTIRNLQLESEVKQLREKLAESKPQWIPVSERLPENGEVVQIWCGEHQIARFNRGISAAEREKMKRGEMGNPEEIGWSLSTGYIRNKRSDVFKSCDEWGNNTVPYNWESTCGPMKWFGQNVTHWKPKDELQKGE